MAHRSGVYYPVLAPFNDAGQVDFETLRQLLEFGVERGVHGVFALGSAGQGPVMENEQRKNFLEAVMEIVDGRVPVIAHIGTADTMATVELAEHGAAYEPEMLAVLPPYYYDHSAYEIEAHFRKVAETVDVDLLVYNNPRFTGIDITPEDLERLSRNIPQVRGIKASFTDVDTLVEYVDRTPDDFAVFSGNITHLLPALYHGVSGAIHPPSSLFPEITTEYWSAVQSKDLDQAVSNQRSLQRIISIVVSFAKQYGRGIYVPLFATRGIQIERYPRWETVPIPAGTKEDLEQAFADANLHHLLEQ